MRPKKKAYSPAIIVFGTLVVIILAYYCAGGMHAGENIWEWKERMQIVVAHPFEWYLNAYTGKTVVVFLFIYSLAALMYITDKKNLLPGREMGSAKYADVKKVNRKLADLSCNPDDLQNIIIIRRRKRRK